MEPVINFDPEVRFKFEKTEALWRSESGAAPPSRIAAIDDRTTADAAMARVRKGEYLLYTGDFQNAKQLLSAMGRRLEPAAKQAKGRTPLEIFRAERLARAREHEVLSRVIVALPPGYGLTLRRAPQVAEACLAVWGPAELTTVAPLKTLLGMLGAAEWHRKGLQVPGLSGLLRPRYGVFLPTRTEYLQLVLEAPPSKAKRVFDLGTGTGVLSFLLLQRGAERAVGTDLDPRSVACANENAAALGLAKRFQAVQADLYPEGVADLVICNPPWLPEAPKNRVDRAVFDEDHRFLEGFLDGLRAHLAPGGQGLLLLSDLAERLGLRPPGFLSERLARAGLRLEWQCSTPALHPRAADRSDPLHQVRSAEVTTLYCLSPEGHH